MERRFNFHIDNYYHVFNRGVEKRDIFRDAADWERFHQLLYVSNSKDPVNFRENRTNPFEINRSSTLADVISYALMPNHYHLLLHEKIPGGISKFLSKATTAYSMYFNIKYERSGPVFCRPFRARHVDDDNYFRWLFSYVNLNPLSMVNLKEIAQKGTQQKSRIFMSEYKYSSFTDYFHMDRPESKILNKDKLLFDVVDMPAIDEMFAILSQKATRENPQGEPFVF